MDSNAILDYAVFRLTPTRTRCDLVLFRGKTSEKLASGLVEPFISHLQDAKDQILKGGYSITLRPPSTDDDAPWFTKATFQRFLRFVSTPDIIERLMRLEQEILQIEEGSLQSNEILCIEDSSRRGEGSSPVSDGITKKPTHSSKSSADEEGGSALGENSKVQLQYRMDTRKALLLKEQAMAYARAVVAGYEIDTIDDLLCFADAFGASRMRLACSDFKDLYKKNHSNDQWIDELAAVQACPVTDLSYVGTSGIVLAGENLHNNTVPLLRTGSDGSKESNLQYEQNSSVHQQFPWMNQMPPYMYGHHIPYFPGYMGFPPPKDHKKHRLSWRKEKNSDSEESESSDDQDERIDSSSSDNDSAEEKERHDKKHSSKGQRQNKKNKKKSSKTVVIRNINYFTSQMHSGEEEKEDVSGNDDSSEAVSLDEVSIREGIDSALASLERHSDKSNHSSTRKNESHSQCGAFQNILLSREDSACNDFKTMSVDADSFDECFVVKGSKIKKHLKADNSFLVIKRNGVKSGVDRSIDSSTDEATHLMMRKKIVSEGEKALFSNQVEESQSDGVDFSSESAGKIARGGEDWFVANPSSDSQTLNRKQLDLTYDGDFVVEAGTIKGTATAVDDSFMVGSKRSASFDEHYASQWKTDITAAFDEPEKESPTNYGPGLSRSVEPDELRMVLARESHESWAPEVDYAAEISFGKNPSVVKENDAAAEANRKNTSSGKKSVGPRNPVKEMRSKPVSKSRLDSLARSKTTPDSRSMNQKSKLQREEEERKRIEELVIQRQKRIAERTAANNGLSQKKPPSKKMPPKLAMDKPKDTRSTNQPKLPTRLAV